MGSLAAATISLAVLLLLTLLSPCAAAVPSIDATRTHHLPLPRGSLRSLESDAFDGRSHGPYSGVSDGRVLRWNGGALGWTTYTYGRGYSAETCTASVLRPATLTESRCGRPLGLRFHVKSGYLYMAGRPLVTEVDGVPLRFTNGVDVDQATGEVYFTDSSKNYQRSQHEMATKAGDSTGRLMRYDPRRGKVVLLLAGLAISTDRTHLVISPTGPCKLLRYWIKGRKAGTSEPFADLPGYPDKERRVLGGTTP